MADLGDIVTIGDATDLWSVIGFDFSPRGYPPQVRLSRFDPDVFEGKVPVQFTVGGPEGLVTVLVPTFGPGDIVLHNGHLAEVMADHGATVRITYEVERSQPLGGTTMTEIEADRGQLVLDNINRLVAAA